MGTELPRFERGSFAPRRPVAQIGGGAIGGKARGLVEAGRTVDRLLAADRFPRVALRIPTLVVLATDVYDAFLERNPALGDAIGAALPDRRLAHAFQQAALPAEVVGDLRALLLEATTPLAVRSSSLLEDAAGRPLAGVYATKMIPNGEPDPDARFRQLVEAIKYVWASTYFRDAVAYRRSLPEAVGEERMAVILQEVVGRRHGERFYPDVSGVGRSLSYYSFGAARREDGVLSLALGLGKTIVDGGVCWSYSPARPQAPPPFGSVAEMMRGTQLEFWAIRLGKPPAYDPLVETEYLVRAGLAAAEQDGILAGLASTLEPGSDRLLPGIGRRGARVLDFAPLLRFDDVAWNDALRALLAACAREAGREVEIEFAATLDRGAEPRAELGFLQVRPLVAAGEWVEVGADDLARDDLLVATDCAAGNGADDAIADVVYLKPATFEGRATREIAAELEPINAALAAAGRPYLLIGFGRWGSRDPWLGVPVTWSQIGGATAIVEATRPGFGPEPSQGSHFFHDVTSRRIPYFWVHHERHRPIDFAWLDAQEGRAETTHVRHARLARPLLIRVDGRSGRGTIERS